MQIEHNDDIAVIDPLQGADLSAFWDALYNCELVVHSGRQDIEVISLNAGRVPNRLSDTQIAAGLCGMSPQVGYAKLVSLVCGVDLDKAHTRTDWSKRPLASAVLQYAADDVRYLGDVADHLKQQLNTLDRTQWAEQDYADMLAPALYDNDVDTAWQRIRGFGNLPTTLQQKTMLLARWRESEAQRANRPRQWIIKDDGLINIAALEDADIDSIRSTAGVHPRFADRHARTLVDLLNSEWPVAPAFGPRPDETERKRIKSMAAAVRHVAAELEVEAEILAPRRELQAAARGNANIRALRGWREAIVGQQIRALMPD